jgi:hypothetical protein
MARGVLVSVVLLALILLPALAVATDDLSAGAGHETGLRHQPTRGWRTPPAVVVRFEATPRASSPRVLEAREDTSLPVPLVRRPFVPPRG